MRKVLIGLVAGLTLGSATVAVASIPDAQGVISACRNKSSGAIRLIDTALKQTCTKSEAAISWNRTGPAGPVGPRGPVGAQGAEGPAGSSPAYVALMDPRNSPIEFSPLTEASQEIERFEDVEPGWYSATALISVSAGDASQGGHVTCALNGGSEENFWAGDSGGVPAAGGTIKLQTTLRAIDQPVIVRCTATGLGAGEATFVRHYQVTLVGFEPVIKHR